MSDYSQSIDFSAKDALSTGDANKVAKGADVDTELDLLSTAIATKYDSNDLSSQAQAQAGTNNATLMTPLRAEEHMTTWAGENDAMIADIHALNLAADALLGWDQSAAAAIGFTLGAGLSFSTTTLNLASAVAGTGMTESSQVLNVIGGNGITANANDIAITNQSVSATVPVKLTSGTLGWDSVSITEIDIGAMSQSADGFLIDDAGVLKVMPYDEAGIKVASVSGTTDTLALTDMNTFIEYTNASAVTVTLNDSVGAVGNVIIIKQTGAGQVTVSGTAALQSAIGNKTRTTDSVITLVCLVEGASAEWALYGDQSA